MTNSSFSKYLAPYLNAIFKTNQDKYYNIVLSQIIVIVDEGQQKQP